MNKKLLGTIACALTVSLTAPTIGAQTAKPTAASKQESPHQAGRPPLTTRPADDAAIIRTLADALGMLRAPLGGGLRQRTDLVNRLQWNATGTVAGPSGAMKADYTYVLSLALTAAREDIRPKGGTRLVRVVRGEQAWNETAPGVGGTWANDQAQLRRLQLARTPFGFAKAVLNAPAGTVKVNDPGPSGTVTISLPIEDVPTVATLDRDYRPSSIKMTVGGKVIETTYSNYRDPDEYGVMFPMNIVEKVDGGTTINVKVSDTRVASYAVFPPPG
jgi:hypothetical protein